MSDLPIDAIVACDAEVQRLRARIADLEADRDRWKAKCDRWKDEEEVKIGPPSQRELAMMRAALDAASKAMIEGDAVAMIAAYQDLKGFEI